MTVHYEDEAVTLHHGDCLDVLRSLPDCSVDAVVTDPPAGIAFMGKTWDGDKGGREQWSAWLADVMREALRVTKPGGHALVWALPRTAHWTACGLEDAGWEIRDRITHLFGSGFPKSLDVSKAIDKAAGAEREVVGLSPHSANRLTVAGSGETVCREGGDLPVEPERIITAPATDAARQWQGWHTALKPGAEDWWVARKPLSGTVAQTVLAHGTGALNVDGCRVEANGERFGGGAKGSSGFVDGYGKGSGFVTSTAGRWPTNVVLDEHAAEELDRQSGTLTSGAMRAGTRPKGERTTYGQDAAAGYETQRDTYADSGGASRFFATFRYQAKAPTRERPSVGDVRHPTVKPLALMQWLVRLVTPPGGVVLEPFAGSGTTVEACLLEGFRCIAIEREADYLPLIEARIARQQKPDVPNAAEALALFDFEEPA